MNEPVFTAAERAALDRFAVPPLSGDFADRLAAAAANGDDAPPSSAEPWPQRSGRPAWRRRASIVSGGLALGLLSAAAAATGYLGEPVRQAVRDAPVIGPIIAQVAPAAPQPLAPKASLRRVASEAKAEISAQADFPLKRSDVIADRIVERLEERAVQRKALGLPPRRVRPREIVQVIRQLPPEERVEVVRRLREIRRERIAERWAERRRMREERRARWSDEQEAVSVQSPVTEGVEPPPLEN